MAIHPGPWGEGMEPWSKDLEQRLKSAVANYIKSIQDRLKSEGKGSGQSVADYIGYGVVQSAISSWINAKSLPRQEYIHALARIKGVSPGEMWDYFYVEADAMPEALAEEDLELIPVSDRFELMCRAASPDQLLEFQRIWLSECYARRQAEIEEG